MKITVFNDFSACANTDLLGYIGETSARKIKVVYPIIEEAEIYRLRFCYDDGICYDVPISDGEYIIDGSLLRQAGEVKVQWMATKSANEAYELVAKSNIITFRVENSLSNEVAPVPTYEQAVAALDKVLALSANKPSVSTITANLLPSELGNAEKTDIPEQPIYLQ